MYVCINSNPQTALNANFSAEQHVASPPDMDAKTFGLFMDWPHTPLYNLQRPNTWILLNTPIIIKAAIFLMQGNLASDTV